MNLTLLRHTWTPTRTLGTLYIDGAATCFTLEDADRWVAIPPGGEAKVPGETCIPANDPAAARQYEVVITYSPRFKRPLPLLVNVPGFEGVRIHPGNTERDTEGCILVGQALERSAVLRSRDAFGPLLATLKEATRAGKVHIAVVRGHIDAQCLALLRKAWVV